MNKDKNRSVSKCGVHKEDKQIFKKSSKFHKKVMVTKKAIVAKQGLGISGFFEKTGRKFGLSTVWFEWVEW